MPTSMELLDTASMPIHVRDGSAPAYGRTIPVRVSGVHNAIENMNCTNMNWIVDS